MTDLFDDEEGKELATDDAIENIPLIVEQRQRSPADARRRLEHLLEEKRLRDELEDFLD